MVDASSHVWLPGECEGCGRARQVIAAECYEDRAALCRGCLDDLAEEVAAFSDTDMVAQDGQNLA